MRTMLNVLTLGLFAALPLTGCDGGDSSSGTGGHAGHGGHGGTGGSAGSTGGQGGTGGAQMKVVNIEFEARVGDMAFDCANEYTGLGSTAVGAKITDFRVYVHDFALLVGGKSVPVALDQDGIWQVENLTLLDFESGSGSCSNGTAELHTTVVGSVSEADLGGATPDGITFKVGVPFELNHNDVATAPSPLNLTALFWNWNGGYKFMRVDSLPAGAPMSFNMHLGSTGCQDDGNGGVSSCSKPNRPEIELTGKDPLSTKIVVDYAAVVATTDLSQDQGGAPGCMSGSTDPECKTTFEKLGLDVKTGQPAAGQEMFRWAP